MSTGQVDVAPVKTDGRSIWKNVVRSGGVRMLILPVSAILGIITTRLTIDNYGAATYAQYGLLVAIGALLPFADLGISAALMNTIGGSEKPATDDHVRRVLTTAIRLLFASGAVILLISAGITLLGVWPDLLGDGLLDGSGPIVAALCLAAIGATLPLGIGQRILSALGKNHVSIALMGLQAPIVLLTLYVMIRFSIDGGSYLAVVPYLVTMLLSIVATLIVARKLQPGVGRAIRDAPRIRTVRGARVFDVAWPMLIQMIALPIAMQTNRIALSHVSTVQELAKYNLASQMFTPIWQVTAAAGMALWPVFARARARQEQAATSPMRMSLAFGVLAAVVALVIALCSGWLAGIASGGAIALGLPLVLVFSVFMVLQSTKFPLGMYMTDGRGLRYQAFMILLMLPVNLGLSWWLAAELGAVGPVIGAAVGVLLFQVLANWVYVRRDLRRVAAARVDAPEGAAT